MTPPLFFAWNSPGTSPNLGRLCVCRSPCHRAKSAARVTTLRSSALLGATHWHARAASNGETTRAYRGLRHYHLHFVAVRTRAAAVERKEADVIRARRGRGREAPGGPADLNRAEVGETGRGARHHGLCI